MFENSVAQQQSPQTSRTGQNSAQRPPAPANSNLGSGSADTSYGQHRLKNAINLGKAVGAKVNDLLRRKEPSLLGDIGVTEVNKSAGALWSCMDQMNTAAAGSHVSSFDSFPRLDPPPPSGKKRLPRALKTTQDMMISSDPVVSSPDNADSSSFPSSPDKMPLIAKEESRSGEEQRDERNGAEPNGTPASGQAETEVLADVVMTVSSEGKAEEEEEEEGGDAWSSDGGVEEHQSQLQPSVPDLINKEPALPESRARPCDVWQESRLASTPRSGKGACRISLGEEVTMGNGCPTGGAEDAGPHPDLLSFE